MCLLLLLMMISPRVAIVFWWLFDSDRWEAAYDTWIWPLLGVIVLPWTTLMWVAVAPFGNAEGADFGWLALAFAVDVMSHAGEGLFGRRQVAG